MSAFVINISDEIISDLHARLRRTRLPSDLGNATWAYGVNANYLQSLINYWIDGFDWRAQERQMNAFPNFRTEIDGNPIHYLHLRSRLPAAIPIMLNHGWPWTFWFMRDLIGPLTDPVAHGGRVEDAFDVIIPSLPGFGFSTPLQRTGLNFWTTADLWATLMSDLGYERFASYGGDWGANVSAQLGHKYADRLIGVHLSIAAPLDMLSRPLPEPDLYSPDEVGWYVKNNDFLATKAAYAAVQSFQPQTIAFALEDSPAALLAWILEKYRSWSDCGGDVESVFSKDDLLTHATIYWATQSGGSAARYYYECVHNPWVPSHAEMPVVRAPTTASIFAKDNLVMPRKWAESYYNLRSWKVYSDGGHFAPVENSAIIVNDIREAVRGAR